MVFDAHAHQASSFPADLKGLTDCAICLKKKFNSSAVLGMCSSQKSSSESGDLTAYDKCLNDRMNLLVQNPATVCDKTCKDILVKSSDLGTLPLISSGKLYRNMLLSAFI